MHNYTVQQVVTSGWEWTDDYRVQFATVSWEWTAECTVQVLLIPAEN